MNKNSPDRKFSYYDSWECGLVPCEIIYVDGSITKIKLLSTIGLYHKGGELYVASEYVKTYTLKDLQ